MDSEVKYPIWTMRDGTRIRIADMETSHIKNTIAMLKRKGFIGEEEFDSINYGAYPRGELAQEAWLQDMNSIKVSYELDDLESELARRTQ
jgi:hypothetical protein